MAGKLLVIAGYLAIGLVLVLSMMGQFSKRAYKVQSTDSDWVSLGLLGAVIAFLMLARPQPSAFAIGAICVFACLGAILLRPVRLRTIIRIAAALFAVLCFATTIAWWRRSGSDFQVSFGSLLALHGLWVACFAILINDREERTGLTYAWPVAITAFFLVGIVFAFSTGFYHNHWLHWLSWHHWGAYVGPAQVVEAGARLLYDVPAQYGLGPTMLLSLTCNGNCWLAMYWWAGALSLLHGVLLAWIAARICRKDEAPLQVALIAIAVFVATFVWTAYPPAIGSPVATPSVSGLRFLPLSLLLLMIARGPGSEPGKRPSEFAHLAWMLGVVWSPESAAQVTVVWWPYYVWASCRVKTPDTNQMQIFLIACMKLAAWFMGTVTGFILIYWIRYRAAPSGIAYLAYLLYPPGPLPINPFGAIWFFGMVGAFAVICLARHLREAPDARETHNLIILSLACYGAASYYLGRSHDNNLLNISVFFLLVLLAIRSVGRKRMLGIVATASIGALLTYPALAGWTAWSELIKRGYLLEFHPRETLASFSYASLDRETADVQMPHSGEERATDAARAVQTISERFGEPVTILDSSLNVEASPGGTAWNAFDGPENYVYMPSAARRIFLARVATALRRPGWLLISHSYDATSFLADYDAVYRRDRQLDFGTYYAIRYVARSTTP
jgi:hypothetical protein